MGLMGKRRSAKRRLKRWKEIKTFETIVRLDEDIHTIDLGQTSSSIHVKINKKILFHSFIHWEQIAWKTIQDLDNLLSSIFPKKIPLWSSPAGFHEAENLLNLKIVAPIFTVQFMLSVQINLLERWKWERFDVLLKPFLSFHFEYACT